MKNKKSNVKKPTKAKLIYHFAKDDKNGDYVSVEVFIGKEKAIEYGDDYHEKGHDSARAFVSGVSWALKQPIDIETKDVDDQPNWD